MQISVTLSSNLGRLFGKELGRVLEVARIADDAGIHQVDFAEHQLIGDSSKYPFGRYPLPDDEPWLDPLIALAAAAAVTRRVRLGTGVLIAPLRGAGLFAKQLATLDVLSGGRLDPGVGFGWQREEYEACGIPFEARGRRMDELLRTCRLLWRGERVSSQGEFYELRNTIAVPRPVQDPLPLWFSGGGHERTARRIAELGIGWIPLGESEAGLARGVAEIRRALSQAGRDPAALQVRQPLPLQRKPDGSLDLERSLEALPRLAELGVTLCSVGLWAARSFDEIRPLLESLGRAFQR